MTGREALDPSLEDLLDKQENVFLGERDPPMSVKKA